MNYFKNAAAVKATKNELRARLAMIKEQEDRDRADYMNTLEALIRTYPERSARWYAEQMSDDEDERVSIALSIQSLAFGAKCARNSCDYHSSMPSLCDNYKTSTRHFIEVDDAGKMIGRIDKVMTEHVYYMG